jgi:surface antigen
MIALLLLMAVPAAPAWADPPPWAPAKGWRKKHDPQYMGYEGRRWPSDYGVTRGNCDRKAIAEVLGAAVGGAIGSRVGESTDRVVATAIGAVIGAVVGAQIGKVLDEEDRACMGQALELVDGSRPVYWTNERTGVQYTVTPGRDVPGERICREFQLDAELNGKRDRSSQVACRGTDGTWRMAGR